MSRKVVYTTLASVAGIGVLALATGARRWRRASAAAVERMEVLASAPAAGTLTEDEFDGLPASVARYFRLALKNNQPIVAATSITQAGQFRTGEGEDAWSPFTATQRFASSPPGFVWDARIRMMPGATVRVRDMYVGGQGATYAAVLALFPVADAHGTPEIASGALQRYLGEAIWFPTALLPSQGVRWTAIDDSTARAELTDGPTTVALDFTFAPSGEITRVYAPARMREEKGRFIPTPWDVRPSRYEERNGMRIPMEADVAWYLDGKRKSYWRGRVLDVRYEFGGD
jgi:Family of unknown function (DUF6920)